MVLSPKGPSEFSPVSTPNPDTGWKPLEFGHFETVKPGEILDF
jgi:hypothetical protein